MLLSHNGGTVRIGILGGIGPEATAEFYARLIKGVQESGVSSNTEFPNIFVNSISAPELVHSRASDEELKPYIEGLKALDSMDPDFIVMACNTIHVFLPALQKEVRSPILDLRAVVAAELRRLGISSLLVFATPITTTSGLYEFRGIKCFVPNPEEMNLISESVIDFNVGRLSGGQCEGLRDACRKYLGMGAQTVLLGCTELALILSGESFPKISTLDVLARATVQKFLELNADADR